jgi:hypothetical protein
MNVEWRKGFLTTRLDRDGRQLFITSSVNICVRSVQIGWSKFMVAASKADQILNSWSQKAVSSLLSLSRSLMET